MDNSIQSIEDAIFKHPLPLLQITDEKVRRTIDKYLPFSTGFEIECAWLDERNSPRVRDAAHSFSNIPDIMEVQCDDGEKRFRIPPGLTGLICLYRICEKLKEHCHFTASGTHYHIDMTSWYDDFESIGQEDFLNLNREWFLKELDTWEYTGTYNGRGMPGGWVRFQGGFKTCEIRIGEMSFDYEILAKRIIHANKLVRRLKGEFFKFKESKRLVLLKKELEELEGKEKGEVLPPQDELNQFIKNRQIQVTHGRKPNSQ